MTEPKVPSDLPQREPGASLRRQLRELTPGDWVAGGQLLDAHLGAAEILHVETYTAAANVQRSHGLFRVYGPGSDTEDGDMPLTFDLNAVASVPLASEAEVAAAGRHRRRREYARWLRALADQIQADSLPLPEEYQPIQVSISVPQSVLAQIAEHLDAQIHRSGSVSTVHWPSGDGWLPVQAQWHAYSAEISADPLGMGYSREEPAIGTAPVPGHVQGQSMTGRDGAAEDESIADQVWGRTNEAESGVS